jgi:hypothetical protein
LQCLIVNHTQAGANVVCFTQHITAFIACI